MLIRDSRRSYRSYSYSELILIQILNLSDTGVPVGTTEQIRYRIYTDAGVPVGTTEQIRYTDAGVPVGTTGHIRYRTYTDAGVPVGTTELI